MIPSHADNLDNCLAEAFRLIARGVADRRAAFHTPVLATVAPDGAPDIRTVVLRAFDSATRTLRFHTDQRSAKVSHIVAEPRIAVHFYDPGRKVQIRLSGRAVLHAGDDIAGAAWAASQPKSRLCYAIAPAPGAPVPAPPQAPLEDVGEANFAVILVFFHTLEWLWLASFGHRRARFSWHGEGFEATWLVP